MGPATEHDVMLATARRLLHGVPPAAGATVMATSIVSIALLHTHARGLSLALMWIAVACSSIASGTRPALGMYAVASIAVGRLRGLGWMVTFGHVFTWIALAAWALTLVGMLAVARKGVRTLT